MINLVNIMKKFEGKLDGLFHDEAMKLIRKNFPKLDQKLLDKALDFVINKMVQEKQYTVD